MNYELHCQVPCHGVTRFGRGVCYVQLCECYIFNALDFYARVICPLRFVPVLYTGVLAKLLSRQAAKFVAASG